MDIIAVGRPALGRITLYLAEATKSVEMAPNGIAIGMIELRGWQVHRLVPMPADLLRRSAYLVRANYDFVVEPDVPPPSWAEVEFEFPIPDVTVLDAVPRGLVAPAERESYELTEQLNFVHRNGDTRRWPAGSAAADIPMPALTPRIDCFGVGGDHVRWRHTGGVPGGTHTGCFVLLVPEGHDEVPVVASGSYHVETDPSLRLRPAGRRDAFTVRLPPVTTTKSAGSTPPATTSTDPDGPRVFVSYAHESKEHKAAVADLCNFLASTGIDVRYDRQGLAVRRNWDRWITTEILQADYVIVIPSPAYAQASTGELPEGKRLGVRFEYDRLVDLLHRSPEKWTTKILPVVLPGRSPEEIPLSFLPGLADYYEVDDLTEDGAKSLLRVLRNRRSTA